MKTLRLVLASVSAVLLIVMCAVGSAPHVATIRLHILSDSTLVRHPGPLPPGGTFATQLLSVGSTPRMTATVKCPQCYPDPQNCPCDSLRATYTLSPSSFVLRVVYQDSAYQTSSGKHGRQAVIAYYALPDSVSGRLPDVTRPGNAARLALRGNDTTFAITIRIPSITIRTH